MQVAVEHGLSLDDLHVPLLVRAMYGDFPIKLVVVVRNPIDRFQSGYFGLNHYKDVYGENPEVAYHIAALHGRIELICDGTALRAILEPHGVCAGQCRVYCGSPLSRSRHLRAAWQGAILRWTACSISRALGLQKRSACTLNPKAFRLYSISLNRPLLAPACPPP